MVYVAFHETRRLTSPNDADASASGLSPVRAWLDANGNVLRIFAALLSVNVAARLVSGFGVFLSVWLFAPAEFARFGALMAALALASSVQFLRYDATIVSAPGPEGLRVAIRLTAAVGFLVWSVLALAAWGGVLLGVVGDDLAVLFLAGLAGRGICRLVSRIAVRDGNFGLLGRTTLTLTAVQPVVLVLAFMAGVSGTTAMGLTDIIGNLTAGAYLIWACRVPLLSALSIQSGDLPVRALAQEWASLPLINLPSTALAVAFTSVPLLVVLNLADASVAGHIALVFRILDVPTQVLAAAISPIAMNRFQARDLRGAFGRNPVFIIVLTVIVAAVFGAICLSAIATEPFLAGTAWSGLSMFLPLVAFYQAGIALSTPLIDVAGLRRSQSHLFLIQAAAMICVGLLTLVTRDWQAALLAFGIVGAVRAALLGFPLVCSDTPRATA